MKASANDLFIKLSLQVGIRTGLAILGKKVELGINQGFGKNALSGCNDELRGYVRGHTLIQDSTLRALNT